MAVDVYGLRSTNGIRCSRSIDRKTPMHQLSDNFDHNDDIKNVVFRLRGSMKIRLCLIFQRCVRAYSYGLSS